MINQFKKFMRFEYRYKDFKIVINTCNLFFHRSIKWSILDLDGYELLYGEEDGDSTILYLKKKLFGLIDFTYYSDEKKFDNPILDLINSPEAQVDPNTVVEVRMDLMSKILKKTRIRF